MRVLIVEDAPRLLRMLGSALRRSGFAVDLASDGEEGLWLAESNEYDVIVLDVMLPKRDGLSLLAELRRQDRRVHVLLLTARDTVPDRVLGLQTGADDYLVKPFALEELLARIQALCRRAYGAKQSRIRIGDLEIDTLARTAWRAGRAVDLTSREYLLLEYLARRRGQVVSRSEIEAHIYDNHADPMSNVVDSAVCSIRKKLAAAGHASLIHTRRGHGYVLDAGAIVPAGR
jgi:DNA-binding response OmpR family regulator